jgi:y4mF family transcriptional regulator
LPAADLGKQVRERRKTLGLRQADLADMAGCSERFVHTVENGKTTLRMDKLLDVLEVLGLELTLTLRQGGGGAPSASSPPRDEQP